MQIVGFVSPGAPGVRVGDLQGDRVVEVADLEAFWSAPAEHLSRPAAGPRRAAAEVRLVPPVLPGARVLCVGLNYRDHAAEGSFRGQELPPHPTLFGRWTASLSAHGAEVPVPADEDGLDWEGEVVAWVGAELADATPAEAAAAVVGYSAFNDLTARRAQKLTSQWTLGKNGDDSGPLGPITPAAAVGDLADGLRLTTRVNGETMQDASTAQMVYPVGETLAFISRTLTLRPGDLLATGTPAGVGYARTPPRLLHPGDEVVVEVERIGSVSARIVSAGARRRG